MEIKTPLSEQDARRLVEDYAPGAFISIQQRLAKLLLAVDAASRKQAQEDLAEAHCKAIDGVTEMYRLAQEPLLEALKDLLLPQPWGHKPDRSVQEPHCLCRWCKAHRLVAAAESKA